MQQRVIHADETPVTIMQIGEHEEKPQKGYVWAYATTQYNPIQAVIYDFQPRRYVMITVVIKHALHRLDG